MVMELQSFDVNRFSRGWRWNLDVLYAALAARLVLNMAALGRLEFSLGSVAVEQTAGAISCFLKNSAIQPLACYG